MKFRLPDECLGLLLEGKPVAIAADRTIDVEPREAAALETHGILRADAPVIESKAVRSKGRAAGAVS